MWRIACVGALAALACYLATGGDAWPGGTGGLRGRIDGSSPWGRLGSLAPAWLGARASALGMANRARERARRRALEDACDRQMPELLDILGLGLSAGLSFDASLELYCARRDTELAHEMLDALKSWQMGLEGRAQALGRVAARVGSASVTSFSDAVCEALAFGSPLAATLEHQASVLREEQRAITQRRVEEAPVRMLVPLGTLVVPAMLLAILGPLLSAALSM